MSIKHWFKVAALGASILALAACSTTNPKDSATNGVNDGKGSLSSKAYGSGLGNEKGFGSDGQSADAKKMQVGDQIYHFDFDNSSIHEEDRPSIEVQARYLVAHPSAHVLLEGHTDPQGSREYNIGLGERRGNSVADTLKIQGVKPEQIRIVSYGAEKLASPGHDESDYALDRRVALIYEEK